MIELKIFDGIVLELDNVEVHIRMYVKPCPTCKGKGSVVEDKIKNGKIVPVFKLCPKCKGEGKIKVIE